jgi:hypothetical protein
MRLHAPFELMEDGTDGEFAFQRAKGGFRFCQLDVFRPQILGVLALEIRAEQVRSLAGANRCASPSVTMPKPAMVRRKR